MFVIIACVITLIIFAFSIESNDSRIVGIPKQEYLNVLVDIIRNSENSSSNTTVVKAVIPYEDDDQEYEEPIVENADTPRAKAIKSKFNQNNNTTQNDLFEKKKKSFPAAKDSFYYLHRNLKKKSEIFHEMKRQMSLGSNFDPL